MSFPPVFTDIWDTTQPPDTQLANLLGQDIRNLKLDIMQRLSLLSGLFANLPTPEKVNAVWGGAGFGLLYFSTDSHQILQWNGTSWVDITGDIVTPALQTINQYFNLTIGSTVINQTPTTLATQAVTMPASGGPWRVKIEWSLALNYSGSSSDLFTFGVTDGTNVYASSQGSFSNADVGGINGAQLSGSYANGAAITFSFLGQNQIGSSFFRAGGAFNYGGQSSYLTLSVVSSN